MENSLMTKDQNFYQSIRKLALVTGCILLIPLIAMQLNDEVDWSLFDFIFAGTLIFGTGFTYKFITRKTIDIAYRVAVGFALFTGFFLIWTNLAVGIIGSENNSINMIYFGVIAVGIIAALIVRFQSKGMVSVLFLMAAAMALAVAIALFTGMHQLPGSSVIGILGVNGFFMTLFIIAALLFRYASLEQTLINADTES